MFVPFGSLFFFTRLLFLLLFRLGPVKTEIVSFRRSRTTTGHSPRILLLVGHRVSSESDGFCRFAPWTGEFHELCATPLRRLFGRKPVFAKKSVQG